MKAAAIQMRSIPGDPRSAVDHACTLIAAAVGEHGAELVVLPEFFSTEYFAQYPDVERYLGLAEPLDGPTMTRIREAARTNKVAIVASIYEEASPGLQFDAASLIDSSGEIVGTYRKTHAPAIHGGYEKLYYTQGSRFPVFALDDWRVGLLICYDWRFPEAARCLASAGADLIVYPFATPRMRMWEAGLATRAWENQVYVLACNKVGHDGTWDFFGNSLIASPYGEILCQAGDGEEQVVMAVLDLRTIAAARSEDFNWRDRRPEIYSRLSRYPDAEEER